MSVSVEEIFVLYTGNKYQLKLSFQTKEEKFEFSSIEEVNQVLEGILNEKKVIVVKGTKYLLTLGSSFSVKAFQANIDISSLDKNFSELKIYGEDCIIKLPDTIHAEKVFIQSRDQSIFETPLFPSSLEVNLKFDTIYTINTDSFPFVKILDLSHNQIQELSDSFSKVVEINLSNNQIRDLVPFPKANVVNLNHNMIDDVDEDIFPIATEVELAENRLTRLTGNIFPNVDYLDLNHNQIRYINSEVLQHVVQLDLSYNQMTYLPEMPNIAELDVQSNNIEDLGKLPSSLEVINLSQNPIRNLNKLLLNKQVRFIYDQPIQAEKKLKFDFPIDVEVKAKKRKMDEEKIIHLQSIVRKNQAMEEFREKQRNLQLAREEILSQRFSDVYNYGNIDINDEKDIEIYWNQTRPILMEISKNI